MKIRRDILESYAKETGCDVMANIYYSDNYVYWLEKKLLKSEERIKELELELQKANKGRNLHDF